MKTKSKKQAHGKKQTFEPTTLEEIVAGKKGSIYQTQDLSEYIAYIRTLDKADLRIHARKVGLVPVDNRIQVERELISRFRSHIFSAPPKKTKTNLGAKENSELYKLLESGR